jgi:hypothetical protein
MRALAASDVERYARSRYYVMNLAGGTGEGASAAPSETARPTQRPPVYVGGAENDAAITYGPIGARGSSAETGGADVAQAAGTRVVTLGRRAGQAVLDVVETAGASPRPLGSVAFEAPGGEGELLLLRGGRALAIHTSAVSDFDGTKANTPQTTLTLLDLAEPARPAVLGSERVQGRYLVASGRDGVARVMISAGLPLPLPESDRDVPQETAVARARKAVAEAPAQACLPTRTVHDPSGRVVASGPLLGCTNMRAPARPSGFGVLAVIAVDAARGLDGLTATRAAGIATDSALAYTAGNRMYLTTDSGGTAYTWRDGSWRTKSAGPMRSSVHAFDISGRGPGRYTASGVVEGHQLEGGISAYGGTVRVATSTLGLETWTTRKQQGRVVVLTEDAGRLRTTCAFALTPGEHLWRIAWFGPQAVLLSLHHKAGARTLDLSDPAHPRLGGRLAFTGYPQSALAAAGQAIDIGYSLKNVLTVGAFDLTRAAPRARTGVLTYPKTWTTVGDDPRMAGYLPARRLMFLPVVFDRPRQPAVLALRVGRRGGLAEAGRYISDGVVMRVLRVGGRLAVVTTGSVAVLDPDDLHPRGSTRTAARDLPALGA